MEGVAPAQVHVSRIISRMHIAFLHCVEILVRSEQMTS